MRILKKPEEFQIITSAALETLSGISDHNSNDNIMKLNSNHTSQSMKWSLLTNRQYWMSSSYTCCSKYINHTSHCLNTKTYLLSNTTSRHLLYW